MTTEREHTIEVPEGVPTRPFASFVRDLARGATHDELSVMVQRLIAACRETGKKGSLTLTLTAVPVKGDDRQIQITDTIKVSLPEFDRAPSTFFADDDNNLRRDDPRQMTLPLVKEVPPPAGVNPKTGEMAEGAQA